MTHVNTLRKVLITGGSGFLGRYCLPLLAGAFEEVHATSTRVAPWDEPHVNWHQIDLLHTPSVVELVAKIQPTHLLHLAWVTEHGTYWNSLQNARWLEASIQLVKIFAAEGGRRVVTAGTCAEYDWHALHCHETRTLCAPATLYGACKHALGLATNAVDGLSAAHTRLFNLFGPNEREQRLVSSVIGSLLGGNRAACTYGEQVRDYMYVKDAAAAHVKLLSSDVQGPVNVACGNATTIRNLVTSIGRMLNREEMIDFGAIPKRPNEPSALTADITRLRLEVKHAVTHPQQQALEETLDWYVTNCTSVTPSLVTSTERESKRTNATPRETISCPLCASTSTVEFIRRNSVPVHQNLVMHDAASAQSIARGTLAMRVCNGCGFVFNAAFDPSLLNYSEQYDNRQICSPTFDKYLSELVRYLIDDCGVRGKKIVEVGCGKGDFVRRLVAEVTAGNSGWGFDPTYIGPDQDLNGRLRFRRSFYDGSNAPADVVICRHVIEHVPNPGNLLRSMRHSAGAQVFLETPCVRWIFRNEVIWDLFYEHCSLFTAESLSHAVEQSGYRVHLTKHVFGGQYLWLEAETIRSRLGETNHQVTKPTCDSIVSQAISYATIERQRTSRWQEQVAKFSRRGVCIWGAGAKGVTFANLVDPAAEQIDCVVDLNPAKQGAFLAGTGHTIIAPEQLTSRRVAHALVLNPNYAGEVRQQLARIAPHIEVVDLSESATTTKQAA